MRVLAIVAASPASGADVGEFLRVLVALHACGHSLAIAEVGDGVGALGEGARLPTDAERCVDALADDGIVPRSDLDLASEIARADAIALLPHPSRSGSQPLVRLRRRAKPSTDELFALTTAGAVLLD